MKLNNKATKKACFMEKSYRGIEDKLLLFLLQTSLACAIKFAFKFISE